MRIELCAIAVEREHQEGFGVEARRRDVVRSEVGDGGLEGFLQEHGLISPQKMFHDGDTEAQRK